MDKVAKPESERQRLFRMVSCFELLQVNLRPRREMWLLKYLPLAAIIFVVAMGSEEGLEVDLKEEETEETFVISDIFEEPVPPLPGLLYPRESESREVSPIRTLSRVSLSFAFVILFACIISN